MKQQLEMVAHYRGMEANLTSERIFGATLPVE